MARTWTIVCDGCGEQTQGRHPRVRWCSELCRRKTLYATPCTNCGARTTYSRGPSPNPTGLCIECIRNGHGPRKWTKENVRQAMLRWAELNGRPPKVKDWHATGGEWPNQGTACDLYGSWSMALLAAGWWRPCGVKEAIWVGNGPEPGKQEVAA